MLLAVVGMPGDGEWPGNSPAIADGDDVTFWPGRDSSGWKGGLPADLGVRGGGSQRLMTGLSLLRRQAPIGGTRDGTRARSIWKG